MRLQLAAADDDEDDGSVIVSSGVRIAAAGGHGPGDDDSGDDDDDDRAPGGSAGSSDRWVARLAEEPPARAAPANQPPRNAAAAQQDADLNDMSWWDVLTPAQQRSMARRLVAATPMAAAPAPAPQTVVVREQRPRRKELKIEDFKGKSGESVEAWLASVLDEVKNQELLGGDTWTAAELFRGAVQHLKGKAKRWYLSLTETMDADDCTFAFLVEKMRAKYGRRENAWQIQQRLAKRVQQPGERLSDFAESLLAIGFGKKVSAESYVEAFLNGMNNEVMATQVRASDPQTLEEAVHYAEDKCGEYGEGRKVTDWHVARQRYRMDPSAGDDEPGRRKREAKSEMSAQIDWKKLGLGFGGDENSPPVYDTSGKPISGLVEKAKKDPLSLAALQAMMTVIGVGKIAEASAPRTSKPADAKPKARVLEVKTERPAAAEDEDSRPSAPAASRGWQGGSGGYGGRGYGGRWSNPGRGRGGGGGRGPAAGHYGPSDTRPIAQRKAESECSYCGQRGHWWRECAIRNAAMGEQEAQQPAVPATTVRREATAASAPPAAAAAAPPGNGQRQ